MNKLSDTGFRFTNSTTHFIVGYVHRWRTVFGIFHAKGCYLEIILFGRVFRVLATAEYR